MNDVSKSARDFILLGVFLIGCGVVQAMTDGMKFPPLVRPPSPSPDKKRLQFMRSLRDELIRQENDPS